MLLCSATVCCSGPRGHGNVLQCVAVCCSVLQCVAVYLGDVTPDLMSHTLQCAAVFRSVLLCVAMCCSVRRGRDIKPLPPAPMRPLPLPLDAGTP